MTPNEFHTYVRPCLIGDKETPLLALEILEGPYRGVVYSYTSLKVIDEPAKDMMARVRFETVVHTPTAFVPDTAFDEFCSEVLIAWVDILSQEHMREQFESLLTRKVTGVH